MTYKQALDIATEAHAGQVDKAGRPYIEHPVFVASKMQSDEAAAVAVLHDVAEDTPIEIDYLIKLGLTAAQAEALKLLTHAESVDYLTYIAAIKNNLLAKEVKLADLEHNSDISRLPAPTEKDLVRVKKYQTAIDMLKN